MLIDGTGAPAQGPFNIVIKKDRIAEIRHALFVTPPELPLRGICDLE
jgi:hypothetical protein